MQRCEAITQLTYISYIDALDKGTYHHSDPVLYSDSVA